MALSITDLREVAKLLVANGESSDNDKPDRRLILAAPEHVAVNPWRDSPEGKAWLEEVLANCRELEELMAGANCLEARDPLSRSKRASRARQSIDPEGNTGMIDDLDLENGEEEQAKSQSQQTNTAVGEWIRRLQEDAVGGVISPYFHREVVKAKQPRLPLLANITENCCRCGIYPPALLRGRYSTRLDGRRVFAAVSGGRRT